MIEIINRWQHWFHLLVVCFSLASTWIISITDKDTCCLLVNFGGNKTSRRNIRSHKVCDVFRDVMSCFYQGPFSNQTVETNKTALNK